MDVDRAITERRTTKRYTAEAVPEEIVRELVELAAWAPNHKMSAPWRFRLLGPDATRALVDVAPADKKPKMTLAPTRLLVSCKVAGDPTRRLEDLLATAAAVQTLLLAATGRGIDSFCRARPSPRSRGPRHPRDPGRRGARRRRQPRVRVDGSHHARAPAGRRDFEALP